MFAIIRPAAVLFVLMTILTGVIYPAIVTGIAKVAFRHQAEGSVVTLDNHEVGSELIAQPFTDPKYFWPRPSAANYDATAGAGSNLAPSNAALADAVKGRADALHSADSTNNAAVPVDLVTASASGLDPHISVAAARYQSSRVAAARSTTVDAIDQLIAASTEPALLGVLGDAKVNVLRLNLSLDHPRQIANATGGLGGWRSRGFMPETD